jgi:hypothetical protein
MEEIKLITQASLAIAAILISICALLLSIRAYSFHKHEATLTGDSNIISFVMTVLDLLERVEKLNNEKKDLFIKLLEDSEFFEASEKGNLEPYYSIWPVDQLLRDHFKVKSKKKN